MPFTPFLEEVAQSLISQYGDNLHRICVVSPNRRAQVFLDAYFRKHISKPTFAPHFIPINKLVQEFTPYQLADTVYLTIQLYKIYKEVTLSEESFDNFFFWGETLLNDFNDIDKHLLNAEDLFKNVASLKEMQDTFDYLSDEQKSFLERFWNTFNLDKLSKNQTDFIEIWRVLNEIYTRFRDVLVANRVAYEGLVYRKMAEDIQQATLEIPDYDKVVFVGFNALNECEHTLFEWLQRIDKAVFFWDYDNSYIKNFQHEAGKLLRNNITKYPMRFPVTSEHLYQSNKKISIVQTSSESAQAAAIPAVLKAWLPENPELSQTALVLANEGMLTPVLSALPNEISSLNVTMGYPVIYAQFYNYVMNFLHTLNICVTALPEKSSVNIKHLLPWFQHPYFKLMHKNIDDLLEDWRKLNFTFLTLKELKQQQIPYLSDTLPNSAIGMSELLVKLTEELVEKGKETFTELEFEQIYQVFLQLQRLHDVVKETDINLKPKTFLQFLRKYLKKLIVPYYGEPLSGLQLMGILETRTIDFKNLIVLSLNEDNFPKSSHTPSFIPPGLRNAFGLPTMEYQDAIYAYYFYRLIQRAENVCLMYNADQSGSVKEASRYIQQLIYDPDLATKQINVLLQSGSKDKKSIDITKNAETREWLNAYTSGNGDRYFSPSALNTYIDCSLKFYFKYFLGLKKKEDYLEEIDALTFGNILHKAIEKLYSQQANNTITSKDIDSLLNNAKLLVETIDTCILNEYLGNTKRELQGNDIIIRDVLIKTLMGILKTDKQTTPFTIQKLEGKYDTTLAIQVNDTTAAVQIGGKIDRVDSHDGHIRIIDYKTGSVKNQFKDMDDLFSSSSSRSGAVFQVLTYAWLYHQNKKEAVSIIPGLYYTRNLFKPGRFDYKIYQTVKRSKIPVNYRDNRELFELLLKQKITELFDDEVPFSQTEETKLCQYCDYKSVCDK